MKQLLNHIKKEKTESPFLYFLVIVIMIYLFAITFIRVPDLNSVAEIKTAMINVLMLVVAYKYGSSVSSKLKDNTIKELSDNSSPTVIKNVENIENKDNIQNINTNSNDNN